MRIFSESWLGQYVLQRLMELAAQQRCGAGLHERSAEWVNQRNGYREREFDTRIGAMQIRIPKLRSGSYFPSFREPRKKSEQALVQEAYLKGVSTRTVDDLVQALGTSGVSKSQVSGLCGELDERVKGFLEIDLTRWWP